MVFLWDDVERMAVGTLAGCVVVIFLAFRLQGLARVIGIMMFGLLAGVSLFGWHMRIRFSEPTIFHLTEKSVTVQGVIQNIPEKYGDGLRYTVALESWYRDRWWDPIRGKVLVSAGRFPEFAYGDRVTFSCEFHASEKNRGRLLTRGAVAECKTPDAMSRESTGNGDPFFAAIIRIRHRFLKTIEQRFAEPYAALLSGLLVGERGNFDDATLSSFRRTGTMHMVAVSGFNVSLITFALFGILTRFIRRQKALWITLALLLGFVAVVGAGASVVRAAIMGGLALIGVGLGRSAAATRLLLIAATVMVAINPWLLWFDLGFELSFVATLGLVAFAPLFSRWFQILPEAFDLRKVASETIAALCATLPISIGVFGTVSFIAPFANLAILLLVPFAMGLGTLAVLLGSVPGIGFLCVRAAHLFLAAIIGFADFFAGIPHAFMSIEEPGVRIFAALLALLIVGILSVLRWRMVHHDSDAV